MTRSMRIAGAAAAALIAAATGLAGGTAVLAAPVANVILFGVACGSGTRCLAVGQVGLANTRDYAQVWNGHTWRVLSPPTPDTSAPATLDAVACPGRVTCIAVGGDAARALAVGWNGRKWRVQKVPAPDISQLFSISCPRTDRCVAVGDTLTITGSDTLAEAWNGTRWRRLPAAATGSTSNELNSVACTSPNRCVALGSKKIPGSNPPKFASLAEAWNGSAWRLAPVVSPGSHLNFLPGVACTGQRNCLTVGAYLNWGQPFGKALAETWNGSAWHRLRAPQIGLGSSFHAVACTGRNACLALYSTVPAGTGKISLLAQEWNGSRWRATPTASLGTARGNLTSISCPAVRVCVAVGDFFVDNGPTHALAERWNGRTWRQI